MAGDGKLLTARTSTTSTSSRARSARYASSSRTNTRSFNIEPSPIVLEISSSMIRVGYAEQFQPQHLILLDNPLFDDTGATTTNRSKTKTESQWYLTLVPVIEHVYDRLMCKPSTRRVVYLMKPYAPTAFVRALEQHLWNLKVPAVVRLDCLQTVPLALGMKRALVVNVGRDEAIVGCYADGFVLEYTYQMGVPCGYQHFLESKKDAITGRTSHVLPSSQADMDAKLSPLLNEHDPSSLVVAILMCLQECPRDLRAHCVTNLVVCGDAVALLPDLPRRVAQKVEGLLEKAGAGNDDAQEQPESSIATDSSGGPVFAMVPVDMKALQPLASRLSLRSCAPYRADFVSWIGASLWAAAWNKYEDDETPIPWTFPKSKEETSTEDMAVASTTVV